MYLIIICLALVVVASAFNKLPVNSIKFHRSTSSLMLSDESSSQIFVGNLPFTVDENDLTQLITERYGTTISSLKIIKDRITGRSRGFGYVSYSSKEDAEAAVGALNGLEIDGRSVKIDIVVPKTDGERRERPDRTDRAPRSRDEFKAFIGNLDFKTREADLSALCDEKFGPGFVKRIDLVVDRETRKFRGFGYVIVNAEEDIQKVISGLNGARLFDRDLRADLSVKREAGEKPVGGERREFSSPSTGEKNSIYIGNLPWDATQEIIEAMLTDLVGPDLHTNVRIATDKETGKPRGFCHVDFKDAESMEKALVNLEGVEVYGRALKVDKAQAKAKTFGGESRDFRGGARRSNDRYGNDGGDQRGNSW